MAFPYKRYTLTFRNGLEWLTFQMDTAKDMHTIIPILFKKYYNVDYHPPLSGVRQMPTRPKNANKLLSTFVNVKRNRPRKRTNTIRMLHKEVSSFINEFADHIYDDIIIKEETTPIPPTQMKDYLANHVSSLLELSKQLKEYRVRPDILLENVDVFFKKQASILQMVAEGTTHFVKTMKKWNKVAPFLKQKNTTLRKVVDAFRFFSANL